MIIVYVSSKQRKKQILLLLLLLLNTDLSQKFALYFLDHFDMHTDLYKIFWSECGRKSLIKKHLLGSLWPLTYGSQQ